MKFLKAKKIIAREDGKPYLIRWNLFECKLFSIKIHRILRSDYDCLHDHPWAFVSVILRGGYVEHREIPQKTLGSILGGFAVRVAPAHIVSRIYHPGNILYRRATDKHKLEIHQPCTSLVITFKKVRPWGFWTKTGWVIHWKYDAKNICE